MFSRFVESFLPRGALCQEMNSPVWSQSAVILVPAGPAHPPECLLQVSNIQFTSHMELGQLNRYSAWATGWKTAKWLFDSKQDKEIFQHSKASRPSVVPTQPHIQSVPGAHTLRLKGPRGEADHSLPSRLRTCEAIHSLLHTPSRFDT